MSKKHPGINTWREHIQLGRRKRPEASSSGTDPERKPPGSRKPQPGGKQADAERRPPGSRKPRPDGGQAAAAATQDRRPPGSRGQRPGRPRRGDAPGWKKNVSAPQPGAAAVVSPLDGEGRPYITLVQFLKHSAAVGTGGAGKHAIRAGGILVNGVEELRPGRKLHAGDVVTVAGQQRRVEL
jgi:ribosome-associated protein